MAGHWEITPAPPLVLVANSDGTESYHCFCLGFEHWHVVRSEADFPAIYREPRRRWVHDAIVPVNAHTCMEDE